MFENLNEIIHFLKFWFKDASYYRLKYSKGIQYLIYIHYSNGDYFLHSISPLNFLIKKNICIKNENILSSQRLPKT